MNDPSTTDNSFYAQDIMKHSIDKVEILKGSQSSIYGANAIGGTIIFSQKKEKKESIQTLKCLQEIIILKVYFILWMELMTK